MHLIGLLKRQIPMKRWERFLQNYIHIHTCYNKQSEKAEVSHASGKYNTNSNIGNREQMKKTNSTFINGPN